MAVFSKQSLITELLDRTELIKAGTQPFLRLTDEQLNFRPGADKWSIAEIFGHLNLSHDVYLRCILSAITRAPDVKGEVYRSGWLGDWWYDKIMPRQDGTVFKIKAPKALHVPVKDLDGKEQLNRFIHQCDALDDILRHVFTKDLQRIRIPFSFIKILKLRLGDNLRYLVAHSERHLLQAHRLMKTVTPIS